MNRHRSFFLLLSLFLTFTASAQQSLYIQEMKSVESFSKGPVFRGAVSSTNLVAVASLDKIVKLYDGLTLTERISMSGMTNRISGMSFTESGQTLVIVTSDGQLSLWNTENGALQKSYSGFSSAASLSTHSENIAFVLGNDRSMKILDLQSGKTLGSTSAKVDLTSLAVHPSGKVFAVGTATGDVQIYVLAKMAVTKILADAKEKINTVTFSRDGQYLAAGTANGNVFLWDAAGLTLKGKLSGQKNGISALAFDPKSRWIAAASFDSTLKFYSVASLSGLNVLPEQDAYYSAAFFVTEETFCAANTKGFLKSWRILESPPDSLPPTILVQTPSVGNSPTKVFAEEYEIKGIVYDDGEIADVTVGRSSVTLNALSAAEEANVPKGFKGKKFSTMAKLDAVGVDSIEISAIDKANHAAKVSVPIQRLSLDEAVEVTSPANNSEIDRVTVKVEFKPWFDVANYSINVNLTDMVTNQQPADGFKVGDVISEEIPLVGGYNQIQLTVIGKSGDRFTKTIGVTRKTTMATSLPPTGTLPGLTGRKESGVGPQRWAVVVGISDYANTSISKLKYADVDAQAFADFLKTQEGGMIDADHMRVLINGNATTANIQDALINFLGQAIDKDFVIIYFAGHGAPEPARPTNTYLLTYDTNPSQLATTAFPMWRIQEVLQRHIAAKKVVVFSDACHSGAISVDFATRGLGVTEQNLFNQYLADLAKAKEGTIVFTASAAGELSQEFENLGHGVFTYYLLEGLRGKADLDNDYTITINELMSYVEEQVKRKTKNAQNPTRSQTIYDKDLPISWIQH